MISASMKAEDGMELPLNMSYFAYDPKDLPSNDRMIADAKDMVRRLTVLRDAPVVDPYTGPAILSGPASGVFFHEIFGHRIQALPTHEAFVGQQIKFIRNHLSSSQCSISIIDHTNSTFSHENIVIITENIYPPNFLEFHPRLIIMDNSNTSHCTKAWQKFCLKNQIPFFKTSEVGTIILKI